MSYASALLVIDVQNAMFLEEDPVYQGQQLLDTIGDLITRARAAQVPVIYIQHNEAAGAPLATGTTGWEIHPQIAPTTSEAVVQKYTPDSFYETTLQQKLNARGIHKLIMVGLQTEYCIDTTCRRARSLGYGTTLVTDAHSTWDSRTLSAAQIIAHHNDTLRSFATTKRACEVSFTTEE